MFAENLKTVEGVVAFTKENFTKDGVMDANGVIDALAGMLYVLSNRSEDNAKFLAAKLAWMDAVMLFISESESEVDG